MGIEAQDDAPQTFPKGQLSKTETQELLPTRKRLYILVAVVALNTLIELKPRESAGQLVKDILPCVHRREKNVG